MTDAPLVPGIRGGTLSNPYGTAVAVVGMHVSIEDVHILETPVGIELGDGGTVSARGNVFDPEIR